MTKKKTAANKIVIPYTPRPLQKDLDHLTSSLEKRDTYVECVKLRAEMDQQKSQVSALWDYTNKLRDKFNGH